MRTDVSRWTCPICASEDKPRIQMGVRDYVTGDSFHLVHCARCGFARTDPVPTSLDDYYPQRYRRFNWFAGFVLRRLYLRRVSGWNRQLPPPGRALEIGSGNGWMLAALRQRGWRVIGTERSIDAVVEAQRAAPLLMFVGGVEATLPSPTFDIVLMFHVLEHFADPRAALSASAARLRPGGMLILGLPNIRSWQARFAGARWMHLDVPRHLCHFSLDAIDRALASSGLRMVHVNFRSFEHDPLGWVQAFLDRLGFEHGVLLNLVMGTGRRRMGVVSMSVVIALSPFLGVIGLLLALASWRVRTGAVMEIWASRSTEPQAVTGTSCCCPR